MTLLYGWNDTSLALVSIQSAPFRYVPLGTSSITNHYHLLHHSLKNSWGASQWTREVSRKQFSVGTRVQRGANWSSTLGRGNVSFLVTAFRSTVWSVLLEPQLHFLQLSRDFSAFFGSMLISNSVSPLSPSSRPWCFFNSCCPDNVSLSRTFGFGAGTWRGSLVTTLMIGVECSSATTLLHHSDSNTAVLCISWSHTTGTRTVTAIVHSRSGATYKLATIRLAIKFERLSIVCGFLRSLFLSLLAVVNRSRPMIVIPVSTMPRRLEFRLVHT